jgi:thiamine pyrophosphate-dependent acetolactate synthase large subunit-like protein
MTQKQLILKLLKKNKGVTFIGSLGTISRDLLDFDDGRNCILPIRGAMGCVMGFGLGYAMSVKHKVIVIVGEGSFLMKLGSIATINKYRPKNLKIIILNNGKYASCGGQKNNVNNIFSNELSHLHPRTYSVYKVA